LVIPKFPVVYEPPVADAVAVRRIPVAGMRAGMEVRLSVKVLLVSVPKFAHPLRGRSGGVR